MTKDKSGVTELPDEFTQEEKKVLEEELLRDKELQDEANPANLLVRGALLRCSCGTHPRKLNLPQSYGVYADNKEHPKVHQNNCVVGDEGNISYYGVCKSNTKPKNGKQVCLEPYVTPEGKKTSASKIDGIQCQPVIVGNWFDAKEDDLIYDMDADAYYPCLTTNSFLVCKYGGIIEVLKSGQETTTTLRQG